MDNSILIEKMGATVNAELADGDTIVVSMTNRAGDTLEKTMSIGMLELVAPTVEKAQAIMSSIARHSMSSTRAIKLYQSGSQFDAETLIESNFSQNTFNTSTLAAINISHITTLELMSLTKRPYIPISQESMKKLTSQVDSSQVHAILKSHLGAYLLLTFVSGVPTLALIDDKIENYII